MAALADQANTCVTLGQSGLTPDRQAHRSAHDLCGRLSVGGTEELIQGISDAARPDQETSL